MLTAPRATGYPCKEVLREERSTRSKEGARGAAVRVQTDVKTARAPCDSRSLMAWRRFCGREILNSRTARRAAAGGGARHRASKDARLSTGYARILDLKFLFAPRSAKQSMGPSDRRLIC